jgi:riboflavin synthase
VFTGIVRGAFEVVAREATETALRLAVQLDTDTSRGLELGASVAVSGACLTVVKLEADCAWFDVVAETLARTRLGSVQVGTHVNIERSLRAGDELGGHWVSGHVWGTGGVQSITVQNDEHEVWVAVPKDWMQYLHPKGFITLDGCSLTIGQTRPEGAFALHLIPETVRRTTLGALTVGARVNLELDATTVTIVNTTRRVLAERAMIEGQQ